MPPPEDSGAKFVLAPRLINDKVSYTLEFSEAAEQNFKARRELEKKLFDERKHKPIRLRPKIEVRLEYGPVAVGLWATVNKPALTPASFAEFIDHIRQLGEPLRQGIIWEGEEVEVVPATFERDIT